MPADSSSSSSSSSSDDEDMAAFLACAVSADDITSRAEKEQQKVKDRANRKRNIGESKSDAAGEAAEAPGSSARDDRPNNGSGSQHLDLIQLRVAAALDRKLERMLSNSFASASSDDSGHEVSTKRPKKNRKQRALDMGSTPEGNADATAMANLEAVEHATSLSRKERKRQKLLANSAAADDDAAPGPSAGQTGAAKLSRKEKKLQKHGESSAAESDRVASSAPAGAEGSAKASRKQRKLQKRLASCATPEHASTELETGGNVRFFAKVPTGTPALLARVQQAPANGQRPQIIPAKRLLQDDPCPEEGHAMWQRLAMDGDNIMQAAAAAAKCSAASSAAKPVKLPVHGIVVESTKPFVPYEVRTAKVLGLSQ